MYPLWLDWSYKRDCGIGFFSTFFFFLPAQFDMKFIRSHLSNRSIFFCLFCIWSFKIVDRHQSIHPSNLSMALTFFFFMFVHLSYLSMISTCVLYIYIWYILTYVHNYIYTFIFMCQFQYLSNLYALSISLVFSIYLPKILYDFMPAVPAAVKN